MPKSRVVKKILSPAAQEALKLWTHRRNVLIAGKTLARKQIVTKAGKGIGLIARVSNKDLLDRKIVRWFYYPREEHFERFDMAASKRGVGGPSSHFRGAVGSIMITERNNRWTIDYIQGHFRTTKYGEVNRALATKYGGWRHRVLSEIFKEAKSNNKEVALWIEPKNAIRDKKTRNAVQQNILKEVAKKEGFTVKQGRSYLVASP